MKQDTQITGSLGEKLAARFLREYGFKIIETNYRRKWGEIDIIAEKDDILHFVEVKATASPLKAMGSGVSPTFAKASAGKPETPARNVSHSDAGGFDYRPEENIRLWKKQRMSRAIRTYLLDKKIPEEKEFEIDVVALNLDFSNKKAKLRFIRNIILEY